MLRRRLLEIKDRSFGEHILKVIKSLIQSERIMDVVELTG